jgi:hypothetical protein
MAVVLAAPPLLGAELMPSVPAPGSLVPVAWGKVVAASVIVTAVAGTAVLAPWSTAEPTTPPGRAVATRVDESTPVAPRLEVPAAEPVAPVAPALADPASGEPAAPRSGAPKQVAPVVDVGPVPLGLDEELARLRQAQAALRTGEAEQMARAVVRGSGGEVYRQRLAASCAKGVLVSEPSDDGTPLRTQSIESNGKGR